MNYINKLYKLNFIDKYILSKIKNLKLKLNYQNNFNNCFN